MGKDYSCISIWWWCWCWMRYNIEQIKEKKVFLIILKVVFQSGNENNLQSFIENIYKYIYIKNVRDLGLI